MQNWEMALSKFIDKYKNEPYFEGAVVCGSYACGNNNEFSDIDVHILISDDQDWRHRGNTEIDGFLIEFFINPIKQVQAYFENDYKIKRYFTAAMIGKGIALFDKNGKISNLQKEALTYLEKELPPLSEIGLAMKKYFLWDKYDELKSIVSEGLASGLMYNQLLDELLGAYLENNLIPGLPIGKIEKIFTDETFKNRYTIVKMPPQEFIDIFIPALRQQNIENIDKLYKFVVDDLGGFDIKNFDLKSPLEL